MQVTWDPGIPAYRVRFTEKIVKLIEPPDPAAWRIKQWILWLIATGIGLDEATGELLLTAAAFNGTASRITYLGPGPWIVDQTGDYVQAQTFLIPP